MLNILANNRASLFLTTVGFFLFLCSSLFFAVSFSWMLLSPRTEKETKAELIEPAPDLEYNLS